uniref:Protein Skeletor, isoforms D/E n=1 Tax=Cacopsylla melanoneura TaxID=428564 RepID=A0A8D8T4B4_9HEMI
MLETRFQCWLLVISAIFCSVQGAVTYYGKYIGPLKGYHHSVQGEVYAVDARTLHIKDFTYDGQGPAAFFWVGSSSQPDASGYALRDERQSTVELKSYRKKSVTLTLPEGKSLNQIKWFSVWCESAAVNFGDIRIPKGFDFPRPQKIGQLGGVHGVSSDPIVIVDAQTLLIPNFSYDGEAPDAKFWVGTGPHPSPQGVRVPDENGKEEPLRRYNRKTIVLTLPGELTVFEIGHFGVWCEAFTVDFGHIQIPANLNMPPSLKMLGVSPQSKLNCEVMHDGSAFEVRWAIAGDSIVLQLVAKLELGEYMSFGLSGDPLKNQMIGADVVVAWIDQETLNGYAVDYYLTDKSQCAGGRGSCPDYRIQDNTDSVRLLNAALVNGYSIVTYQRPLRSHDILDHDIYTNQSQAIIWAIGPLNSKQEVSFHSVYSKKNILLDFGRTPHWNCPIPEGENGTPNHEEYSDQSSGANIQQTTQIIDAPTTRSKQGASKTPPTPAPARREEPWEIPPIQCNEPEDGVLYAQMGPTGGKHGYPAITGHVGWGISWYINGLLIPEVNVVRGKTYTFIVEGGLDPDIPAKYHPFYITDDPIGGYQHKTPEEKENVRIFAGAKREKSGSVVPTGVGRLCNWTPDPEQPSADDFVSFGAYQRTLSLICDHGEPGVIQWTPDANTPDTVYYQCFTHRYLGWKINVLNSCDKEAQASEPVTTRIRVDDYADDMAADSELESRASIKDNPSMTKERIANEPTPTMWSFNNL